MLPVFLELQEMMHFEWQSFQAFNAWTELNI